MRTIAFIGFGLIGGSVAKCLLKKYPDTRVYAYARNRYRLEVAREDGVVDTILDSPVDERLSECDMIFLCAPVGDNLEYLPKIAKIIKEGAIITDVGSTKGTICNRANELGLENCFIGGHPMAGSERTGYGASSDYLFSNAYYVITPLDFKNHYLIETMERLALDLNAIPLVIDAKKHDEAVAAVSHLPHIVASALVNIVKESDDEKQIMKTIAAGGFRDITRIAASSPVMWEQICDANSEAITDILDRYIDMLREVSESLKKEKSDQRILHMFESSSEYRNSLSNTKRGVMTADHTFSVDVADEVGAISTLSVILASKGITVKNIGINNARDHGEGALRIAFYDEVAKQKAWDTLTKYHYDLRG